MASSSPAQQPSLSLGRRSHLSVKNTFLNVGGSPCDLSPGSRGMPDRRSSLSSAPETLAGLDLGARAQAAGASSGDRAGNLLQVPGAATLPRGQRSPSAAREPFQGHRAMARSPSPRYVRVPDDDGAGGSSPATSEHSWPTFDFNVASLPTPARTASRWPSASMGDATPARTASRWPSASFEGLGFGEGSPRDGRLDYSPAFTASRWPSANLPMDSHFLDASAVSDGLSGSLDDSSGQASFLDGVCSSSVQASSLDGVGPASALPEVTPFAARAMPCDWPADAGRCALPLGCFAVPAPCSQPAAQEDHPEPAKGCGRSRAVAVASRRVPLSLEAAIESGQSSAAASARAALSALDALGVAGRPDPAAPTSPQQQKSGVPAVAQHSAPELQLAKILAGAAGGTCVAPGAQASAQAAVALFQQAQQLATMASIAAAMSVSAQAPAPPGLASRKQPFPQSASAMTAAPASSSGAQESAPVGGAAGKRGGGRRLLRMWAHIHLHMQVPGFDLVPRLIGRGGCNVRGIAERTGAKIRVRGRGSGHLETNGGTAEAPCPLMVAVTTDQQDHSGFAPAVAAVLCELRAIEQRFDAYCEQAGISHDRPRFSVGTLGPGARDLLGPVLEGVPSGHI